MQNSILYEKLTTCINLKSKQLIKSRENAKKWRWKYLEIRKLFLSQFFLLNTERPQHCWALAAFGQKQLPYSYQHHSLRKWNYWTNPTIPLSLHHARSQTWHQQEWGSLLQEAKITLIWSAARLQIINPTPARMRIKSHIYRHGKKEV